MATPQVLDFSQTGVLDIQDGSGNSLDVIHLRQVNYVGQVNASFSSDMTNPDNTESVFIGIVGRIGGITLDIRNITSPSYADTQALIDAIKNNIAAMYAGGGGGGGIEDGDTLSIGLTFPQNGLKTEAPSGDTLSINANGTQTADRTLSIDIGDSDKQLTISGDATIEGTNTGDVKTQTTHWREWASDDSLGDALFPSTLADLLANIVGPSFSTGVNMGVRVALSMPSDYNGEAMELVVKGTANAGNNGNAKVYCKAVIVAPSSNLASVTADGAIPTPNTVSMATIADGDAFATSFTITPSGDAWTSGCQLVLLMGREGANVGDTHDEGLTLTNATINW